MRDIAIIGGGLVGLCAALILQHSKRQVTVLEAAMLEQVEVDGLNARSIALAASSVQIFRALGIWSQIEKWATPIQNIHVSSRGKWGVTRLRAADHEFDALGYVIESQSLGRCLLEAVEASKYIKLQQGASFASIEQKESVNIGYRKNGRVAHLEARLALVADGADSPARQALGIDHQTMDYGQSVVISNVEVSQPAIGTAYERFTTQGPLAMLPLGDKRYACIWTLTPTEADSACAQSDADFCAALQDCFGHRLGLVERAGKRFSFPIQRTRANALQSGRCLLVGNAANALHPVAGQSFNLSLRDVACLYELLCDQRSEQPDGDEFEGIAADYEKLRLQEQRQVIRYGDGLVTLFSNELPMFEHLRAAGLGLLDLLPALKTQAALAGMGMSFGGNRLLRGHL